MSVKALRELIPRERIILQLLFSRAGRVRGVEGARRTGHTKCDSKRLVSNLVCMRINRSAQSDGHGQLIQSMSMSRVCKIAILPTIVYTLLSVCTPPGLETMYNGR